MFPPSWFGVTLDKEQGTSRLSPWTHVWYTLNVKQTRVWFVIWEIISNVPTDATQHPLQAMAPRFPLAVLPLAWEMYHYNCFKIHFFSLPNWDSSISTILPGPPIFLSLKFWTMWECMASLKEATVWQIRQIRGPYLFDKLWVRQQP